MQNKIEYSYNNKLYLSEEEVRIAAQALATELSLYHDSFCKISEVEIREFDKKGNPIFLMNSKPIEYSIFDTSVDFDGKLFAATCFSSGDNLLGVSYAELMTKIYHYRYLYIVNQAINFAFKEEFEVNPDGTPKNVVLDDNGVVIFRPAKNTLIDVSEYFADMLL